MRKQKFHFDPIVIGVVILTIMIFGGIILAAVSSTKNTSINQYSTSDSKRPIAQLSQTSFDFGTIKLSDTKTKDITLTNIGVNPLDIRNFSTSCNCTFVQIIDGSETSPNFSMHYTPDWSKQIGPNKNVILKITYQPSLMPVEGEVERTITFKTNDPNNSNMTINFKAIVEK